MGKRIAVAAALVVVIVAAGLGLSRFLSEEHPKEDTPTTSSTPAPAPEPAKPEAEYHIRVVSVRGAVDRQRQGTGWVPLHEGDTLNPQESIRTDQTGRTVLEVGETATVTVDPQSQFSVREIGRAAARVRIDVGRIGAVVHGRSGSTLRVESKGSDAVAEADEGEFAVQTTGTGQVAVATRKGLVRLSARGETVEIVAGQQSVVHRELPPAAPEAIPTSLFLKVTAPPARIQREKQTTISGRSAPGAIITINGVLTESDPRGEFHASVGLREGRNRIIVAAEDVSGNREVAEVPEITVKSRLSKVRSKPGAWGAGTGKN